MKDITEEKTARLENELQGSEFSSAETLEELVKASHKALNAPNVDSSRRSEKVETINHLASDLWNHIFFFESLCSHKKQLPPSPELEDDLITHFNGQHRFQFLFASKAQSINGAGWTWLVDRAGHWELMNTFNYQTPLVLSHTTPLLNLDVFEHSYFLDYGVDRLGYARDFFSSVDWSVVRARSSRSL